MAYDDKMIMTDILTQLKFLGTTYGTAMKEASNQELRTLIAEKSQVMGEKQFAVFQYMAKTGMYPMEYVDADKIQMAIDSHAGCGCACK
ncbi:MAG: spore coat protein [Firmicutes bacterium]|nr:spore coat protein [Bacillota bacterium]